MDPSTHLLRHHLFLEARELQPQPLAVALADIQRLCQCCRLGFETKPLSLPLLLEGRVDNIRSSETQRQVQASKDRQLRIRIDTSHQSASEIAFYWCLQGVKEEPPVQDLKMYTIRE